MLAESAAADCPRRSVTGAMILCAYLGVVSVRLHDFWNMTDMAAATNETEFFKNLGMMGGLLMVAAFGPGRWAGDARREPGTPDQRP